MTNLDERIARIRLRKRVEEEEEKKIIIEENKEALENEVDLNKVIEDMKAGEVELYGQKIKFKEMEYLEGKLKINVPIEYMEVASNEKASITLMNDNMGLSLVASYSEYVPKKQSFKGFKKGMEKQFKASELYLEWLEEGFCSIDKNIPYGIYKSPTGKGDLYNLIFYKEGKNSVTVCNYNCFYKDLKIWQWIIKATVMLMEVK